MTFFVPRLAVPESHDGEYRSNILDSPKPAVICSAWKPCPTPGRAAETVLAVEGTAGPWQGLSARDGILPGGAQQLPTPLRTRQEIRCPGSQLLV